MTKVLVTGASGFLGRYIIDDLLKATDHTIIGIYHHTVPERQADHRLTYVKCNLYDAYSVSDRVATVDYVIHAAAIVSFNKGDEAEMQRFNVESTSNIVNACLEHDITKLVHISSISALGRHNGHTIDATHLSGPDVTYSPYGKSKKQSELEVWRGIQEGLTTTILNPSLIMGAGDWTKGSPKMIQTVAKGIKYYPTGATGFVYAKDVAHLARAVLTPGVSDSKGLLCSAENATYQEVMTTVAQSLGVNPPQQPIKDWHISVVGIGNIFARLLRLKSKQIITKESLLTAAQSLRYDGTEALEVNGFEYTPMAIAIDEICQEYLL